LAPLNAQSNQFESADVKLCLVSTLQQLVKNDDLSQGRAQVMRRRICKVLQGGIGPL
jgi:hypothetical protein